MTASMAYSVMQTFLIPALPRLREDLDTTTAWVTWTVTIYLLAGCVATPLLSRLGDQHGRVRLMLVSLGIFTVGSLGAIMAWDVASLVVFRAVQGVGGAVFPLSFALIRDLFPARRQALAMGVVSSVLGLGGGVGIVASGLIVDNASWRWLFVVSAATAALAMALVWRFIPEPPGRAPAALDIRGALTLSGGLICMLVALTEGRQWGWASPPVLALIAGAVVLFVAWVWVEMRADEPMVDLRLFVRRPVLFTNLTALMSGFGLYMIWVLLPTFYQLPTSLPEELRHAAQYGFGTSVTEAGLWTLPTSLAIIVAGPVAGMIGARHGSRLPLAIGMGLMAVGGALIALWHGAPWQPSAAFALCGVGIGFSFAAMPKLILDAVPPAEAGIATGMNTVVRIIGGVIGAQVGATLLAASEPVGLPVPTEGGFTLSFWLGAAGAALGMVAAIAIGRDRAQR